MENRGGLLYNRRGDAGMFPGSASNTGAAKAWKPNNATILSGNPADLRRKQ